MASVSQHPVGCWLNPAGDLGPVQHSRLHSCTRQELQPPPGFGEALTDQEATAHWGLEEEAKK